jgi:thiol-disulfide isomerase/thioredoxin
MSRPDRGWYDRAAPDARRRVLRGIAAGATAIAVAPAVRADADAADPPQAPWPVIGLLDGGRLEPAALRDQAVVLVVWATYCPFCRRHNARLERLHRSLADRPMRVITAATDRDIATVRRYMAQHGFTFPVTLDADLLRQRFGLRAVIPMTITFDRTGRLLQRIPGEMAEDDVMALARLADV